MRISEDEDELDKDTLGKKVIIKCSELNYNVFCFQIIEDLSPEKLAEYREIFSFFDRDGGGSIGVEEFQQVMRTFGWNPKEEELKVSSNLPEIENFNLMFFQLFVCQDMVSVIDQDGDGDINFNEFVWLMTRFNHLPLTTNNDFELSN